MPRDTQDFKRVICIFCSSDDDFAITRARAARQKEAEFLLTCHFRYYLLAYTTTFDTLLNTIASSTQLEKRQLIFIIAKLSVRIFINKNSYFEYATITILGTASCLTRG